MIRATNRAFVDHCCELLGSLGQLRAQRMFSGWALRLDGVMVALVIDERLYLKTDVHTQPIFLAAGGEPFGYEGKSKRVLVMSFITVPLDAMDAPHEMAPWARLGLEAGIRAEALKARKRDTNAAKAARAPDPKVVKTPATD